MGLPGVGLNPGHDLDDARVVDFGLIFHVGQGLFGAGSLDFQLVQIDAHLENSCAQWRILRTGSVLVEDDFRYLAHARDVFQKSGGDTRMGAEGLHVLLGDVAALFHRVQQGRRQADAAYVGEQDDHVHELGWHGLEISVDLLGAAEDALALAHGFRVGQFHDVHQHFYAADEGVLHGLGFSPVLFVSGHRVNDRLEQVLGGARFGQEPGDVRGIDELHGLLEIGGCR